MNLADTEIIHGILHREGYVIGEDAAGADAIFLNTCSIREHAEQRVYGRLATYTALKKRNPHLVLGVLGCMAERLRRDLIDTHRLVDIVCGPDEYRHLPELIDGAFLGLKGVRTELSRVETYDDLPPLRTEGVNAWLSVMRGCDNFCSYCVVPFTRGRERSRPLAGILSDVRALVAGGFRDVTLLGQNVNSWRDGDAAFADLLLAVSGVDASLRVRFITSHPADMSDRLIEAIASRANICPWIHLPVQSGSNRILALMNRGYTREQYLERVRGITASIPGVALSTDIIAGFPTESGDDHRDTLALLREARFDSAFMFKYSPRENTRAWKMGDDVPDDVKTQRLEEIIRLQRDIAYERNRALIGTTVAVLLEGRSKRSDDEWMGRTDTNKTVIIPGGEPGHGEPGHGEPGHGEPGHGEPGHGEPGHGAYAPGDLLHVAITSATSATLFGVPVPPATAPSDIPPASE